MINFIRSIFPGSNFMIVVLFLVAVFLLSFFVQVLYFPALLLFFVALTVGASEIMLLYFYRHGISASRPLPERFSNGDDNEISITVENHYPFKVQLNIIDELPAGFQERDFQITTELQQGADKKVHYSLKPVKRGSYQFGKLLVFATFTGLFERRYEFSREQEVAVYPAFKSMKQYLKLIFAASRFRAGMKQVRKPGHTKEFEHIRDYVTGDDYRFINWSSTARRGKLMVNQYRDQTDVPIYSIIDKGRSMKSPFEGMTLLDYAINATLVISGVINSREDKAGLCLYSDKIEGFLPAAGHTRQIGKIMDVLYHQQTTFPEPDFFNAVRYLQRRISQRSLLIWFTNFETKASIERHVPALQNIARHHTLLVVFFRNTILEDYVQVKAKNVEEIYLKTIAEEFEHEKKLIAAQLEKSGIHTLMPRPGDLNMELVNKYLDLKSSQVI